MTDKTLYHANANTAMAELFKKHLQICPLKRTDEGNDAAPMATVISDAEMREIAKTAYRMADAMLTEGKRMANKYAQMGVEI